MSIYNTNISILIVIHRVLALRKNIQLSFCNPLCGISLCYIYYHMAPRHISNTFHVDPKLYSTYSNLHFTGIRSLYNTQSYALDGYSDIVLT